MSFKGIGKAVVRAPQSFKQKFNMGEQTNDPVYLDAERRFKELETETKKLSTESSRYFSAINGMLDHQIGFAKAIEEIFKPISGVLSDPNSVVPEDNPTGIEASEQYRVVVGELQETLKPDLELIENRIVKPAQDMLKIIGSIRKMSVKRNHKQLDLDRRLATYNKYANKKERTDKDEEKMLKAQAELEVAQQEYNYYNDMLKTELPMLFQIQAEFVKPLFVSFYYMQLNIFYSLFNKLQDMKITYFDLGSDIMEHFHASRGNIEEQTDALTITHFRVGYTKFKLDMTKRLYGSAGSSEPQSPLYNTGSVHNSAPPVQYPPVGHYDVSSTLPPYSPASTTATTSYTLPSTAPAVETCTALYDYTAQVEGDLSFPINAIIEIEDRSDAQGWWIGRYNGKRGNFPGNYVRLNKV